MRNVPTWLTRTGSCIFLVMQQEWQVCGAPYSDNSCANQIFLILPLHVQCVVDKLNLTKSMAAMARYAACSTMSAVSDMSASSCRADSGSLTRILDTARALLTSLRYLLRPVPSSHQLPKVSKRLRRRATVQGGVGMPDRLTETALLTMHRQ